MSTLGIHLSTALLWAVTSLTAQTPDERSSAANPNPATLARAIEAGLQAPGTPFTLRVDCTDEESSRSLELFPRGVATWNRRAQVALGEVTRSSLLEELRNRDFVHLEPRYGGRTESAEEAALRVSCRIELEIDGLRKSSIQLLEGKQSKQLLELATELLDLVEPVAEREGVGADNLEDGLDKLIAGTLTPEAFELRWVSRSEGRSGEVGTILRIGASRISRQAYSPGRELGDVESGALEPKHLLEVITAVHQARIWTWPPNLWSNAYLELEVRVLNHRHAVIARSFGRLTSTSEGEAQIQFDRLVSKLLQLKSHPIR